MAEAAPLRIATYNLESLDFQSEDAPGVAEQLAELRGRLGGLGADVLCLQEVNGQRPPGGGPRRLLALERLCEGTGYTDFHVASTQSRKGHGVVDIHNLVVLSRWPFEAVEEHWHDLVAPPHYHPVTAQPPAPTDQQVCWDRPILRVSIRHPTGLRLEVINLHLRAPLAAPVAGQKTGPFTWKSLGGWAEGFYLAALKRSGQALEARLLVERLFDRNPQALIAVCGDCNAELREMPLRILLGDFEDIDRPELIARQLVPVETDIAPARRYSLVHGGEGFMLDHILVSRGLHRCLARVEVRNLDLVDEVEVGEDELLPHHAPLVADFDLAPFGP